MLWPGCIGLKKCTLSLHNDYKSVLFPVGWDHKFPIRVSQKFITLHVENIFEIQAKNLSKMKFHYTNIYLYSAIIKEW